MFEKSNIYNKGIYVYDFWGKAILLAGVSFTTAHRPPPGVSCCGRRYETNGDCRWTQGIEAQRARWEEMSGFRNMKMVLPDFQWPNSTWHRRDKLFQNKNNVRSTLMHVSHHVSYLLETRAAQKPSVRRHSYLVSIQSDRGWGAVLVCMHIAQAGHVLVSCQVRVCDRWTICKSTAVQMGHVTVQCDRSWRHEALHGHSIILPRMLRASELHRSGTCLDILKCFWIRNSEIPLYNHRRFGTCSLAHLSERGQNDTRHLAHN